MTPTAYKCYSFDGTDYTDISSQVINDVQIPVLVINPDQSPVLQGIQLETVNDLSGDLLADNEFVCLEIGSAKKWYGYVESSYYDYGSKTWNYNIFNIFENLKNKTCYTDLYPNITGLGTARSSSIYSGSSAIAWRDITLKELIEHIMEQSDYTGVTHTVTWSYGTGFLQTVLENFCVSSLCIKNLGTDYSDDELTAVSADPDVKVWDLLSELFKILGLRYYYTDALAITICGSDTATSGTDYKGAGYDSGKWINKYSYQVKKLKELKKFVLKQNILNIDDTIDPENIHRYFSPVMYGIPYLLINWIKTSTTDTANCDIMFTQDHKIPSTDNTQIKRLKFETVLEEEKVIEEDIIYKDADELTLIETDIEQTRFTRTNLGSTYSITQMDMYISGVGNTHYAEITTGADHDAEINQYDLSITSFFDWLADLIFAGKYTYNSSGAGIGYPATSGQYNVDTTTNTIKITRVKTYYTTIVRTITNDGSVIEDQGTAGDPHYISYIHDYSTGGTPASVKRIYVPEGHGITGGSGDELFIFGTGDSEYDGNSWSEQTTLEDLATGEYYVASANYLYLYDDWGVGNNLILQAKVKYIFPKYQNYANLTDGKDDKNINWTDYLVIYRPNYSSAGDWKQDWWTIDMEDATYCLLMNYASYVPWWYYTFSSDYQTITSETFNFDDTVTPVMTTARRIIYNVRDHSIDLEQDSV